MVKNPWPSPAARLTVLYDADCGFCQATTRWLRRRDRAGRLAFLPLQDAVRAPQPTIVAAAATHDLQAALHVVDGRTGAVYEAGEAMLVVLGALPRWHTIAHLVAAGPGRRAARMIYRLVAGQRDRAGRWLGVGGTSCRADPDRRP